MAQLSARSQISKKLSKSFEAVLRFSSKRSFVRHEGTPLSSDFQYPHKRIFINEAELALIMAGVFLKGQLAAYIQRAYPVFS